MKQNSDWYFEAITRFDQGKKEYLSILKVRHSQVDRFWKAQSFWIL